MQGDGRRDIIVLELEVVSCNKRRWNIDTDAVVVFLI